MQKSIAASTKYVYGNNFRIFRDWCLSNSLPFLPSNASTLRLFLSDFASRKSSAKQLNQFMASIKFTHDMKFLNTSFLADPSLKRVIEGASRVFGKPLRKMKPLGEDLVKKIIDSFILSDLKGGVKTPIDVWRTVFISVLTYFACSRFNCINKLLVKDISFDASGTFFTVHFPRSKTDQRREGNSTIVASQNSIYCPVRIAKIYLSRLKFVSDVFTFSSPLFPKLLWNKTSFSFDVISNFVTYNVALSEFRRLLTLIGLNAAEFGLHSGRAGAATDLSNKGVSEARINVLGRWKSSSAVQGYIQHSTVKRIATSKVLGFSS